MPEIAGVRVATGAAGIKYKGRTDVLLALFDKGTAVAGVLTRSKCPSAPVEWCRAKLKGGRARVLVVNSGNANAFTGKSGREAVAFTAKLASEAARCKPAEVFLASTGVIGEPLKAQAFEGVMGTLVQEAAAGRFHDAAKAIMTTDTFPKVATARVKLGNATVTINGIAKGAGMIAPDMATMLCYVATDARIPAGALQALLKKGVDASFNCTTVDSDTSPRTPCCCSPPARPSIPGCRRKAAGCWPTSPGRSRPCCWIWRSRWCATARVHRSWCGSRSAAAPRRGPPGGLGWRWQTRRW